MRLVLAALILTFWMAAWRGGDKTSSSGASWIPWLTSFPLASRQPSYLRLPGMQGLYDHGASAFFYWRAVSLGALQRHLETLSEGTSR
jgi:hypothetical protein